VPLYRDVIGLSAYEYFQKRFGYFARLYSSLGFVLAHFSKMGSVFFLLSLAVSSMTGIDTYTVIIVLGIAIIVLTLLGGMEAVIWLDVIQGFLLIFGGLITLVIISMKMDAGLGTIIQIGSANNKFSLGSFDWDFVNLTFWVMAINGIFYTIQKYGTDQTIVQRYLTARSDRDAIKASIMGVLLVVPVWALFMFIGTALFAFYQGAAVLPEGIRADAVFPHFIMSELPVGVVGIIISALMAAAISSLDSDLNCLAAVGVDDYYRRLRPDATDQQCVRVGKILVVLSGIGAIGVASIYVSAGNTGVLGTVFALYAIFSGGIAGMFLLGIFVPRANKQGLYVGIAACVIFTAAALLTSTPFSFGGESRILLDLGPLNYTQHKYMLGVYSHIVLFFVAWGASYLFPAPDIEHRLTYVGWKELRANA
jgi:SSS family solute:Na+ symporter